MLKYPILLVSLNYLLWYWYRSWSKTVSIYRSGRYYMYTIVPKACYRSGSIAGGTPQRSWVRSPSGANFSSGVKKTPSLVPRPKHCGARPNSQGDGPPCTGGAGVRGFSWPAVRRPFYLSNNVWGRSYPLQVKFLRLTWIHSSVDSYEFISWILTGVDLYS